MNPPKLGTVWPFAAKVQCITGDRWETVTECIDTPNAITAAIEAAKAKKPGAVLFVKSTVDGRRYPADMHGKS